eukprot:3083386-Pyramimonas_sp.AAC.1
MSTIATALSYKDKMDARRPAYQGCWPGQQGVISPDIEWALHDHRQGSGATRVRSQYGLTTSFGQDSRRHADGLLTHQRRHGHLYVQDSCTRFYTTTENAQMDFRHHNSIFMRCEEHSGFTHANAR